MRDNPDDHKHSDYEAGIYLAIPAILFASLAILLGAVGSCQEADLEERLDTIECQIAEDEVECLRDLLK